jgi:hypothetical protein
MENKPNITITIGKKDKVTDLMHCKMVHVVVICGHASGDHMCRVFSTKNAAIAFLRADLDDYSHAMHEDNIGDESTTIEELVDSINLHNGGEWYYIYYERTIE